MGDDRSRPITLLAVGDIMTGCSYFHSLVGDSIPDVMADPDRSLLDERVVSVLNEAELVFGNLECVVSADFDTDDGIPPRLMGPMETVPLLDQAGFDVVNLANNHILDHGPAYVDETTDLLEAYGIRHVGNPLDEHRRVSYRLAGRTVTFEGFYLPDPADREQRTRVISNLGALDVPGEFNVVSLHWGQALTEHMKRPAPAQVEFARDLIDRGVDVVLGHHSHTFQPVERYEGGLIAYSLGNFVFDMWREKNRKSGILKVVIDRENEIRASVIPVEQIDYQVRFVDGHYIDQIQDTPVEGDTTAAYRSASRWAMRTHMLDVIGQLAMNFHRFPPRYHLSTFKRWGRKGGQAIRNRMRSITT